MIVGILGGGQLARMLALAGLPLGLRFVFLDPAEDACARHLGEHLCGAYDDPALLARLAAQCDRVTFEFENVPARSIEILAEQLPVYPAAGALAVARDRMREKTLFRDLEIPTVPFKVIDSLDDLRAAVAELGLPAILKTRTMGYDGKGQVMLRNEADIEPAWQQLGAASLILEGFADFQREVSIVAARDKNGNCCFYPLSENVHENGILKSSVSRVDDPCTPQAEAYARKLLNELDYVGVMALELFHVGEQLLANEMAPRVHNSGHWTIEGAVTSQFENHLRAILGWPMGSTEANGYAAMVNFIGTLPATEKLLAIPDLHLHAYDKAPRPGRKVGHATVCAIDPAANPLDKVLTSLEVS